MDKLWILGDNFIAATYRERFLNRNLNDGWFMKDNFEVFNFCNSRFSSSNQNIPSRIQITVASAINEKVKLPQVMLIVLHNDLLKTLNIKEPNCCATIFGSWIEWLADQINRMINERLDSLPKKAVHDRELMVYWVQIPQHKGWEFNKRAVHAKFNNVLDSVIKTYSRMHTIKFKDGWDTNDDTLLSVTSLFGLSDCGLNRFWEALDHSVSFNIAKRKEFLAKELLNAGKKMVQATAHSSIADDPMKKFFIKKKMEDLNDQFHWFKRNQRREEWRTDVQHVVGGNRFILPRIR